MRIRRRLSALLLSTALSAAPAFGQNVINQASQYPQGAVPVTSSATGTTSAVVATLPGVSGKTTYLCGFNVTGTTSTTANSTAVTVAGTISGSLNFNIQHPVTPSLGNLASPPMAPCIPASAQNTSITVTSAADAGGSNVAVAAWGYQQ
jgi:hypothetical protein